MAKERRTQTSTTPCPRCGTPLEWVEERVEVDEVRLEKWARVDRRCPKGCQYTADEIR